jgi:hypothetical protein
MLRWLTAYLFALASAINPALAALTVNQLSGFNAFTASGAPPPADPTVEFQTCKNSSSDSSTYSFTSTAIGAEASDRLVLVGTATEDGTNSITHPTVVINGVDATESSTGTATYSTQTGFAIAAVPTGTSVTISVTYSETMTSAGICVWALYGFSSATFATNTAFGATGVTGFGINKNLTAGNIVAGMCVTKDNNDTISSEPHFTTADWTATNASEFSFAYGYTFPVATTETLDFICAWSSNSDVHMRIIQVAP